MTILQRMHNPYVDVKSICLFGIVYTITWIDKHVLFIHLGSIDVKVLLEIFGAITAFFTATYNAIKTYSEVIGIVKRYRDKKKEKEEMISPPDDDQFD